MPCHVAAIGLDLRSQPADRHSLGHHRDRLPWQTRRRIRLSRYSTHSAYI